LLGLFAVVDFACLFGRAFDVLLNVAHRVLEIFHPLTQAFHEFRDFLGAKEYKNKEANQEYLLETHTAQKQKNCIHNGRISL
jgi:hypothetical protein